MIKQPAICFLVVTFNFYLFIKECAYKEKDEKCVSFDSSCNFDPTQRIIYTNSVLRKMTFLLTNIR